MQPAWQLLSLTVLLLEIPEHKLWFIYEYLLLAEKCENSAI